MAQELTPEQRAWLRGHASDPSLAGGWARRAAEVRARREELSRGGRLAGLSLAEAARQGAALSGSFNVAVLAVTYPDVTPQFSTQDLGTALFGAGDPGAVSVAQYYSEISQGLLRITGEVTSWIRVDSASSYYLPAIQYGWPQRGRFSEWLASVFLHADSLVDFGRFDNDGPDGIPNSGDDDGVVDLLWILYATDCRGEWRNGFIWPGGGQLYYQTGDRSANGGFIRIGPAVFMNAQRSAVCAPIYSGVLAHETGHAFGLPDLYDYDFSSNGVGYWDLMAYGLYNTEAMPAYIGAYGRERLGWIMVNDLPAPGAVVRVEATELAHAAFRFAPPGTAEYFLLENRQPIGSDAYLPGRGLLVWHIDPSGNNSNESRKLVDLEEADGLAQLDHATSMGDAGDPFPGSTNNRRFGARTNPNSTLNTGTPSGLLIDAIASTSNWSVSATLPAAVAIVTDSLRGALMGAEYADTLSASQGVSDGIWGVSAGVLPPGLVLALSTGIVSGVPERAGRFTFTVRVVADVLEAQRAFTIEVAEPGLSLDDVVAHLLHTGTPLTSDQTRYLDLLGNRNGRLDVGDLAAWLDTRGGAVGAKTMRAVVRGGRR